MKNFIIIFILVSIDQLTKFYISTNFILGKSFYITEYLNLIYIINSGLILGIFSSINSELMFFIHFFLFVLALLIIYKFLYSNSEFRNISLLFYSGAVGNTIDRIFKDGVIDFIDFHYSEIHWPAFNFADLFISLGIILMLYKIFKGQDNRVVS